MASKTLTISLPEDMLAFLDENPMLSPSKVFQGAVENIRNSLKCNPQLIEANKEIERLKGSIRFLQNEIERREK
jgi:hypothetical protein